MAFLDYVVPGSNLFTGSDGGSAPQYKQEQAFDPRTLSFSIPGELGATKITEINDPSLIDKLLSRGQFTPEIRAALEERKNALVANYERGIRSQEKLGIEQATAQTEEARAEQQFLTQQESERKRMSDVLSQIFGAEKARGTSAIEESFIPLRTKAIEEEAALGRLRSPLSAVSIGKIDEAKGKALSSLLSDLTTRQAQGEVDLSKSLESLLANERRAREQKRQFGQELGLRKEQFGRELGFKERNLAESLAEGERGRSLSRELGQLQAEASRPREQGFFEKYISPFIPVVAGGLSGYLGRPKVA